MSTFGCMQKTVRDLAGTPWLRLREIVFKDREGSEKRWSFVSRTGSGRAVVIIAETDESPPRVVLVKEFRPAVGNAVIAFPAGLVDEGEDSAGAALRELEEETGWCGDLIEIGPPSYSSPGLTDEIIQFARVRLRHEKETRHELEEDIEVLLWPRHELRQRLDEAVRSGSAVDAKLWAYVIAQ